MPVDLRSELEHEARLGSVRARRNYVLANVFALLSILSSFAAALVVGLGDALWSAIGVSAPAGRVALAGLSGAPAVLLLVRNTLQFEARSRWYWAKTRQVQRLLRRLRDDPSADVVAVSAEFSAMSEGLEDEWPSIATAEATVPASRAQA